MSSHKNENTKQIKNRKEEEPNKIVEQHQQHQKQQIEDTEKFTISDTTSNNQNEINNINEYQTPNKANPDTGIETTNKYQQQTVNSIQSFSDNSINLQQNIFTTFQSTYSKFINDILFKSYWNNFLFPTAYLKLYYNSNQILIDNTINTSKLLNDLLELYLKNFNISIEFAQKYYKDGIRNYFNFGKKAIE